MVLAIHNMQLIDCVKRVSVYDVDIRDKRELNVGEYIYKIRGWIDDEIIKIELMGNSDTSTVEVYVDESTARDLISEGVLMPKMKFFSYGLPKELMKMFEGHNE